MFLAALFDAEKKLAIVDLHEQKSVHQCRDGSNQRTPFNRSVLILIFRIEGILGLLSNCNDHPVREDVNMISTSSGQPIVAQNLSELLQQIVLDTLQEPLRWS